MKQIYATSLIIISASFLHAGREIADLQEQAPAPIIAIAEQPEDTIPTRDSKILLAIVKCHVEAKLNQHLDIDPALRETIHTAIWTRKDLPDLDAIEAAINNL